VFAEVPGVSRTVSLPSAERSRVGSPRLWVAAVLFFGLGDVVTTFVGLGLAGVAEANPVAVALFRQSPVGATVLLKGTVFGACYLLWRRVPRPHCVGVPLGLTAVGVVVTTWNLHVLLRATLW